MAGVKISNLPAATDATLDDLLPMVDVTGSVTQKVTVAQLQAAITGGPVAAAGEAVAAGQILCKANDAGTAKLFLADANASGRRGPSGFALAAAAMGANVQAVASGVIDVPDAYWVGGVPAVTDVQAPVYLSTTAGSVTLTPPATAGDTVVQVGVVWRGGAGSVQVQVNIGQGTIA